MNGLSAAHHVDGMMSAFVAEAPAVRYVVMVSPEGLPLAISAECPDDRADQLAAVACGMVCMTRGAARMFNGGAITQTVVAMQAELMLIMAIEDGSCLAVMAEPDCDMAVVAYQMARLAERAGQVLMTPGARVTLQTALRESRLNGSTSRPGQVTG